MALQMPCHNSHQIFGVVGLHQNFRCPLKDLTSIGFSYFQHLLEVGILFQFICHQVTALRFQHNLEVTFYLQICCLWSHEVVGLGSVALELPRQFVSPELVDHRP